MGRIKSKRPGPAGSLNSKTQKVLSQNEIRASKWLSFLSREDHTKDTEALMQDLISRDKEGTQSFQRIERYANGRSDDVKINTKFLTMLAAQSSGGRRGFLVSQTMTMRKDRSTALNLQANLIKGLFSAKDQSKKTVYEKKYEKIYSRSNVKSVTEKTRGWKEVRGRQVEAPLSPLRGPIGGR